MSHGNAAGFGNAGSGEPESFSRESLVGHLTLNNGLHTEHNYLSSVFTKDKLVWMESPQVSVQGKVRKEESSGNINIKKVED